jgi:hypothetical protein
VQQEKLNMEQALKQLQYGISAKAEMAILNGLLMTKVVLKRILQNITKLKICCDDRRN